MQIKFPIPSAVSGADASRRPAASVPLDEDGNTIIEFALVLPVLLLFVLGIMQGALAIWNQNELNYAVQEAARCASINTSVCGTSSNITSFAAARSSGGFSASVFSATTASCGNQVSASYPMQLPFPFSTSVTLTARACYPT